MPTNTPQRTTAGRPAAQDPEFTRRVRRSFGKRLRVTRVDRGLTQESLAERLGLSAGTIRRYENGTYSPPIAVLLELRRTLKVSLDYLLAGTPAAAVRHVELGRRLRTLDELPAREVDDLLPVLDAYLRRLAPPSATS
jgi:transcriptional regulator with XRE-family HTH domain